MSSDQPIQEIDVLDFLTRAYLLIKRRFKIIVSITILALIWGIVTEFHKPKYYVEISFSSKYINKSLIDEVIKNIFFADDEVKFNLEKLGMSPEIAKQIDRIKLDNTNDSILYLNISLNSKPSFIKMTTEFIKILTIQEEIKPQIQKIELFKKEYLQKLNEKILEIENYNSKLLMEFSTRDTRCITTSSFSNTEYFTLMDKKINFELDASPPISCIINQKTIKNNSVTQWASKIALSLFLGLIFALLFVFIYELLLTIKKKSIENIN